MIAVIGVVVMAYGTPRRREDIAAYYTDIRRGRPPSDKQLADLTRRYDAIAIDSEPSSQELSLSPLADRTERQRAAIASALDASAPGRYVVEVGLRHAEPTIEQAVAALADRGASVIVGLVLAPHYSTMSIAAYLERAANTASTHGVDFVGIESWATEPAFVEFLAGDITRRLADMPHRTDIVFTAHSLPERILAAGDRYPDEVNATASAVASTAGLADARWSVGWQSAGRTAEPWIGPDILEIIDGLAGSPIDGLLVCPCGFVADHLEVLYDLDIEASRRAAAQGLAFARTTSVNDDPGVMDALAQRVIAAVR